MTVCIKFRILYLQKILHQLSMNAVKVDDCEDAHEGGRENHDGDVESEREDTFLHKVLSICLFFFAVDNIILVNEAVDKQYVGDDDLDAAESVIDQVGCLPHTSYLLLFVGEHLRERLENESHR